jgi:hypothetical protein
MGLQKGIGSEENRTDLRGIPGDFAFLSVAGPFSHNHQQIGISPSAELPGRALGVRARTAKVIHP